MRCSPHSTAYKTHDCATAIKHFRQRPSSFVAAAALELSALA